MNPHFIPRSMISLKHLLGLGLGVGGLALASLGTARASTPLAFSVTLSGDPNTPTISIRNQSHSEITRLTFSIGDVTRNFDFALISSASPGVSMTQLASPDAVGDGVGQDTVDAHFSGFGTDKVVNLMVDVDSDGANNVQDYRTVFFNNGVLGNSVVTAYAADGSTETLTLSDGLPLQSSYSFLSPTRPSTLTVESVEEAGAADFIRRVSVLVNGQEVLDTRGHSTVNIGEAVTISVLPGEKVQITAPQVVYKNMASVDITDSVLNEPAKIQTEAQERFTAIGISVNDVPQTGDPTLYQFDFQGETSVVVKWRHDYALTVKSYFANTESVEKDATGRPWAGPLTSQAEGNPDPTSQKHWIRKGDTVIAQVDGSVLDFSRPGLDLRYVPSQYIAFGPPNRATTETRDHANRVAGVDISQAPGSVSNLCFNSDCIVPQSPPQRLQVPEFTMFGPGGITYVWQIQYGVKVNVDTPAYAALPKVFTNSATGFVEAGNLEGVFWFNPGTAVRVGTAANVGDANSAGVNGWMNGDGYYFSSTADLNTADGTFFSGGPVQKADGSYPAQWLPSFTDAVGRPYRGLEIPQLQRPARVLWRYGPQAIVVNVVIGEYVFQHDPARAALFTLEPDQIVRQSVSGQNKNVGDTAMAVWDPVAAKLYPVVPGQFKASWRPSPTSSAVDVIVIVTYPSPAHYPHIANTPAVALDPDPSDSFVFKEIKYTENSAVVDGNKRFTAQSAGKTVLLFSEIQKLGRGQPREFLRVRVVDTRKYTDVLAPDGTAVIGRKITDPVLDKAQLGTGWMWTSTARYNPFIYDASKFEGLASKDIYDLTALRSNVPQHILVNKAKLAGPIIPVNLDPGASPSNRIVVIWYADPTTTDEILWPQAARRYLPVWPTGPSEGLGRIVIASQFGSESLDASGQDQEVVPPLGLFAAATTYDPSRLQQAQIYSQPDNTQPGYNPNEEHALMAPSLRYADVSPRPPAVYALRANDLNQWTPPSQAEGAQSGTTYTSHPYVLVQFFDLADQEFKMRVYSVVAEDVNLPGYRFARESLLNSDQSALTLRNEPHVVMKAGEPVIPFYPLVEVIGASPCAESTAQNFKNQLVYWEDHKGSSWAVSGGDNAWFSATFYYPLLPGFWWPAGKPGSVREVVNASHVTVTNAVEPQTGDCVSFLPHNIQPLLALAPNALVTTSVAASNQPVRILFKSDWPDDAPILKAGETLTFSGGEYHADHPFVQATDPSGNLVNMPTLGLPGVVAFAAAEVVFDSLNPFGVTSKWTTDWTARVGQVLEQRSVSLPTTNFPVDLQPATKRTRVKEGQYVFTELPASLQNRVRYDPLNGRLLISGRLNDKATGDRTLTASPGAIYILEPNIMTPQEKNSLLALSTVGPWTTAVQQLYKLSRNPGAIDTNLGDDATASDTHILPEFTSSFYRSLLEAFWRIYYAEISGLPFTAAIPPPVSVDDSDDAYLVGLEAKALYDGSDRPITIADPVVPGLQRAVRDPRLAVPLKALGPGLALLPNPDFLNPSAALPDISYVSVVENNDPSLGGLPITIHIIKVDRRERYRGAIKTVVSDNVFDENLVLRHSGDFGANADALYFEWWYRPDDGSLDVPPPDLLSSGQANPWKLFPDPSGNRGRGWYQITLKGNPNAPEVLLADSWWFCRYRHTNDTVSGTNWKVRQTDGSRQVNYTWAGAANSDPLHDLNLDGLPDYKAQLAMGWIKRVLDAVNPYEARIRDFTGDNPATVSSMISQFGARFEGPVALNPDKNVIENVGLIELYETILKRGRDLSIDLSRPVATPAIANALQLASTRICDFYTILGNEGYVDALDPTVGIGSDSVEYGSLAPSVFAFQNQLSSLIEEELGLLRGVDDSFARPVYNRLFWNFTKGEGEAAYAMNYNISDVNHDGFIDEKDAMILYPQGHGDAWGHYLTALRNQYELLQHPYFNWVSRSEFYNLQDVVLKVDFLDERKFAQTAAAKAKVGAEVVNLTYRAKYVETPEAQWQGYGDSNPDRAWGVEEWARRAGQGAYFDWITANALLPSVHPNATLEGIQKVDRQANSDIAVISANLAAVQTTFDSANKGQNPLGLARDALVFDIDPTFLEVGSTAQIGTRAVQGLMHFDQIYERALKMLNNAVAVWDNANENRNRLRQVANSETEFRNSTFQEDLSYKNQLIKIFGRPYDGTIGSGKLYPAGYDGPDLLAYMYVDVRQIDNTTVPGPTTSFATFNSSGTLTGGDVYQAFVNAQGSGSAPRAKLSDIQHIAPELQLYLSDDVRRLFAPTFVSATGGGAAPATVQSGLYAVNYTDLVNPKVPLLNLTQRMPVTAAGYTYQAPRDWGTRGAAGDLQLLISQMIQQEASVADAIGAWDSLQGGIVRELRFINAKIDMQANIRVKNEVFARLKTVVLEVIKGVQGVIETLEAAKESVSLSFEGGEEMIPKNLPTGGLSVSPGDALSALRGATVITSVAVEGGISAAEAVSKIVQIVAEGGFAVAETELDLFEKREEDALAVKEMFKDLENMTGDEPIKRIAIFKEIENLRQLSDQYRTLLNEGSRLIDERAAYNKRVAAQTQQNRYQDMTFRVARNQALQNYRSAFDLAARYAYLTAKAYDYETNFDPTDPGSPATLLQDIVRARTLGQFDGEPRMGAGGLAEALAKLKINYDVLKGQLGVNNPQIEIGKISLRTELFRILPKGATQPVATSTNSQFPSPGKDSDTLWQQTLQNGRVSDLWQVPEYRYLCRPFSPESDASGTHNPEPGLVLRFGSQITAGFNFFGKPLSGGDHIYDPSQYTTKIQSVGIWLADYLSSSVLSDLPATPRLYLIPAGVDIMGVPNSPDPSKVRIWKVLDQRIPVPIPAGSAQFDSVNYIPLLDSLNGRFGEARKYSTLRAYHDGTDVVNMDELVLDTRLVGRSIWNTGWILIVPGRMLNADPNLGLDRFIAQVSDIRIVFRTYGISGN